VRQRARCSLSLARAYYNERVHQLLELTAAGCCNGAASRVNSHVSCDVTVVRADYFNLAPSSIGTVTTSMRHLFLRILLDFFAL